MFHKTTFKWLGVLIALTLLLASCAPAATPSPTAVPTQPPAATVAQPTKPEPTATVQEPTAPPELVLVNAGWVAAIDQIGLPIALEKGFFEEEGLDVKLLGPYPTGVDQLNALQAGEINIGQVGVPAIGAILKGMDLVLLGNYTGSSVYRGIDETMAMIARKDSGIDGKDLTTLKGKKIAVSIGSISHLYALGVLEKAGLTEKDVELVNTKPADMAVALQTGGVDAMITWDPWPIVALFDVPGSYEVLRGGGFISFIGYIVGERNWVAQHPDIVVKFLTARAKADKWMRENPDQAAEIAVRWLPGLKPEVAKEAMKYNIKQLDPRFSACNYLALETDQQLLNKVGAISGTIDVSKVFEPKYILQVMQEHPELFEGLEPIPQGAEITPGFVFDANKAAEVCK